MTGKLVDSQQTAGARALYAVGRIVVLTGSDNTVTGLSGTDSRTISGYETRSLLVAALARFLMLFSELL